MFQKNYGTNNFKAKETTVSESSQSNDVDEIVDEFEGSIMVSSSSSQTNVKSSGGSGSKSAKKSMTLAI